MMHAQVRIQDPFPQGAPLKSDRVRKTVRGRVQELPIKIRFPKSPDISSCK